MTTSFVCKDCKRETETLTGTTRFSPTSTRNISSSWKLVDLQGFLFELPEGWMAHDAVRCPTCSERHAGAAD